MKRDPSATKEMAKAAKEAAKAAKAAARAVAKAAKEAAKAAKETAKAEELEKLLGPKPSKPKSAEMVISRVVKIILGGKSYPLISKGAAAQGNGLEYLVGIDGGNSKVNDGCGVELKYHSGEGLITLLHRKGEPTNRAGEPIPYRHCMRDMLDRYNYRREEDGKRALQREIVIESSNLCLTQKEDNVFILPREDAVGDRGLYWRSQGLYAEFIRKLNITLFVAGHTTKGRVTYEHALRAEELGDKNKVIDAVMSRLIVIEADTHMDEEDVIRDHGTKFRILPTTIPRLWARLVVLDTKTGKWLHKNNWIGKWADLVSPDP